MIGMTASHVFAPWDDPGWTIAAHPCTFSICQRKPDWWFDLHPPATFRGQKRWHRDYVKWLQSLRQPIFMQEDYPDILMAIRYPRERIMSEYRAYFTNHVAWMIALAMTEGVTHIGVFGCEYAAEQERGVQRGSLEFWLGMFEGRGGHVILPPGSAVLNKPPELYGYESHDPITGILIPAYRKAKVKPGQPGTTDVSIKDPLTLQVIDSQDAAGRVPLMQIPDQAVAWERSGHTIHA